MKKAIDWNTVFLFWLSKNLDRNRTTPYLYKDLGKRFDIAYKTIRSRAGKDKWQKHLAERLLEQNQMILTLVQEEEVLSEAKVRQKQALDSRKLLDKAMARLNAVKPEDLTVKQAIDLARLGLTEERKALGLPDRYEVKTLNQELPGTISVEDRVKRHKQLDNLANKLFEYLGKQKTGIAKCI